MKTLNDERIKCNKTVKQVADELGIVESYASMLLNGERRMSLDNAQKLAILFNTSIDHIFLLYNFTRSKVG